MPARHLQYSMRTQLTAVIFLVAVLVTLSQTVLFAYGEARASREQAVTLANNVTKTLSQDAVQVLLLDSTEAAADMALNLEAFENIDRATFFSQDEIPLMAFKRNQATGGPLDFLPPGTYFLKDHHLITCVPLQYQANHYGTACYHIKTESFRQIFLAELQQLGLIIPVLLLLSFLLSIFVQRFFSRPVERLVRALQAIGINDAPPQLQEEYSTREMNQLVSGFNDMADRVITAQQETRLQKERLQVTLDAIADGVIATDAEGRITLMNPAAVSVCGWQEEVARGRPLETIYRLLDETSGEPFQGLVNDTLAHGTVQLARDHLMLQSYHGDLIHVQTSVSPIRNAAKEITGAVVIFQNITETRTLSQQLQHQATHDPLTQLLNRAEFERQLAKITEAMNSTSQHALLYLDLDQFKVVNDTSGHVAGDALLRQIAVLLQEAVRNTDIVARMGGDEFAILLPKCTIQQAMLVAEKIRTQLSRFAFGWEDRHFRVGVSIGLVPLDQPDLPMNEILTQADVACYTSKDLGRNRIHVYRPDDKELLRRRGEMQWVTQINDALENNSLLLFAQKIIPLNNENSSQHIEILIRHLDEDGTLRTPGAFFPAIERYSMAPEVDRWIIRKILEDNKLVDFLKGAPNRCVNINLSGLTLGDAGFVNFVSALLRQADLPPRSVCFEITETAAVSNFQTTIRFIRSMKLLGCDFALDDFGSGVSSFTYLRNLPVEYLKIDGNLIRDIDRNPVNEAMVNAINEIGHVMKIKTVAEFVESGSLQDKLVKLGVDYAQGYYIHKPAPLHEVIDKQCAELPRLQKSPLY